VGSQLRQWLQVGRRLAWFNKSMGGLLAATAVWLVATQLRAA
jgi:threonine/homoserine/homoserine lactone efflux protein